MTDIIQFSGDAVDSAAQRLGLGLGTDTFPNPKDFGIGGEGAVPTNADDIIVGGLYRLTSSTTGTPKVNTATMLVNVSYNVITQTWDNGGERYFRKSTNTGGTWTTWRLNFDSGNSVNPLDFGIGSTGPTITEANQPLSNGLYSGSGSAGVNFPTGQNFTNFLNMTRANNTNVHNRLYLGETAFIASSNDSGQSFTNRELFHTGNSVNPLDFGLGPRSVKADLANDNLDDVGVSGFFTGYGGAHSTKTLGDNPFPFDGGAFNLVSQKGVNNIGSEYSVQTATLLNPYNLSIRVRSKTNSTNGWCDWVDSLNTGNTNLNVFGGIAPYVLIGNGHCSSAGTAFIYLDLNSFDEASTISFAANSTFKLIDETGSVIRSGIPISQINLDSDSSGKKARLRVFGNTSLNIGKPCELRQDNAIAKITVNF